MAGQQLCEPWDMDLISLVEAIPMLWDSSHEKYKKRKEKDRKFAHIALQVGATGE
jgi:hypothetical protein